MHHIVVLGTQGMELFIPENMNEKKIHEQQQKPASISAADRIAIVAAAFS
jgi:hypothetical protein